MNEFPQAQKALANRLAELLSAQDLRAVVHFLDALLKPALNAPGPAPASTPAADRSAEMTRVGIWERRTKDAQSPFVRVQTGGPWTLWANVGTIPPKSRQKRIVLLGESVARGYFYDPYFNPATALRNILNAANKPHTVEVIDLARIDLGLDALADLSESALALQPDAMVIFAGNNWHYRRENGSQDLIEIARILRAGEGWPGIHSFIQDRLRQQILQGVGRLAAVAKGNSVPIVFVIPEFNLAGWRSACFAPPILDLAATSNWLAEVQAADSAFRCGNLELAAAKARRVVSLDQGTTPAGLNILADIALFEGKPQEARKYLEQARDCMLSQPVPGSPRCYSLTREIIRSCAVQAGIIAIDLRSRFDEYLKGQLPDHRLFLDYCHLTIEGITLAMASAAEALLPRISGVRKTWSELAQVTAEISPQIMAEAEFLAAVHNANYGQSPSVVRAQIAHAIQLFPHVKQLMSLQLQAQLRKSPLVLSMEFERIMETRNASVIQRLYTPPRSPKAFNSSLVNELAGAMASEGETGRVRSILINEHAVDGNGVNLLGRFYCGIAATAGFQFKQFTEGEHRALQPLWSGHIDSVSIDANSCPIFFKARERTSSFLLVCEKPCDIALSLTCRLPGYSVGGPVLVMVNGSRITSVAVTKKWGLQLIVIPSSALFVGPNILEILWPSLQWPSPDWIEQLANSFEAGHYPEIQPVYGEICSFRAAVTAHGTEEEFSKVVLAANG